MTDDSSLIAASLAQLVKEVSNLNTDQRQIAERIGKVEDVMIRFDERQRGWATKQELAEVESRLKLDMQPLDASNRALHRRLDEFTGTLQNAVTSVRQDFLERDERMDRAEAQIVELRLGWAKLSVLGGGSGLVGGLVVGMFQALGGG